VTWKDLKRFISDNNYNNEQKEEQEGIKLQQSAERFRIFRHLPFWIPNIEEHKKADIAIPLSLILLPVSPPFF
jgi:hypothetical protein